MISIKVERGYRSKVADLININDAFSIRMSTNGPATYDTSCFGIDPDDKLSDDRYMVFYNQVSSPLNEITYSTANAIDNYSINLNALPPAINKLVFAVSIDGDSTMSSIASHKIEIAQNGNVVLETELSGKDFHNERAIVGIEIYRKNDQWRITVVARGFDGGLDDLLRSFGGEVASDDNASTSNTSPAASAPTVKTPATEADITDRVMKKVNLSKDKVNLEKHVVNLSMSVVDLSKKSGVDLGNLKAKVIVALDYSGSMRSMYRDGTVQETITRLVPLGLTFDDNGSIEFYLFQNDDMQLPDIDLSNYDHYVSDVIDRSGYRMGGTNYAPVLNHIIFGTSNTGIDLAQLGSLFSKKSKDSVQQNTILPNDMPTFILFITDGANSDESATSNVIIKSSNDNVFIQFIGIGHESFRYLRKLDDLPGRTRDNTGFTKMEDIRNMDDSSLYNEILGQFTNWLRGQQ